MKKITVITIIAISLSGTALAHKGAKGIVKVRMDAMSSIGKNMKSISAMLTGKTVFDSSLVSKQAAEISSHAAIFPDHFKENLKDHFTEAAPAIWLEPKTFKALSDDLARYADQLSQKAASSNNFELLRADFKAVAGTCKSCHEKYRIKK